VLVLVALIMVLLLALGVPGQVSRSVRCALHQVFGIGGGCSSGPIASNVMPCPTSASTRTASDEFQVFFIDAGHKNTLIKTVFSNGRVDYTLVDNGTLEAQAKLQAELEAGPVGFDAEAKAAAGGELTGSYTFSFANAAAASAFEHQVQSAGGWGVIAHDVASGIPIAAPVANGLLNLVGIDGVPNGSDLAHQYHRYLTSAYVGAGAVGQLNLTAEGEAGPVSLDLKSELKGAPGFREVMAGDPNDPNGPKKGDVQVYLSLDGSADGSLMQALFGPQASAAAKGNAEAVVTLDSHGNPVQLEITASGSAGASAGLALKPAGGSEGSGGSSGGSSGGAGSGAGDGGAPAGAAGGILRSLDASANMGAGQGYQYKATLDLGDNPQAVQTLVSVLNPASSGPAMTQLISDINTQGTQRIQPFQQTTSHAGGGVVLEIADIGGGATVGVDSQHQNLFAGWVQNPGGAWQPVVCQT
jgi:hypothetical protein